jgi:signal transduction histidine kinase
VLAAFVTAWVIVLALAAFTLRLLIDRDTSALSERHLVIIFGTLFVVALTALLLGSYCWVQHQRRVMREENKAAQQHLDERLERLVQERTQQIEMQSQSKPDLLANLSHELRSPLNIVIGFSDMLKTGLLGELEAKQQDAVSDILGAGTQLLTLINDVLNLSKAQTASLGSPTDVIDLPALFKASVQMVKQQAINARIGLILQLDPALATLVGNELQIKQILYALLANAIRLSPAGGNVTLRARPSPWPEDAGAGAGAGAGAESIEITIEDGGASTRQLQGSHFCIWLPLQGASDVRL